MRESEFAAMLANDDRHWWYRGRRRVLAAVLDGLELPPHPRILDAGCGSGRTLDDLARRGSVAGVDVSAVAVRAARRRGHRDVRVARIEQLPFADRRFDLVTCLDVLEHAPDDREALAELLRVTRPGGSLVVTVPAYPGLFSAHDVVNGHYRRYRAQALRTAAARAGWTAVADTHFNAVLLGPAAAVRLARRGDRRTGRSELAFTPRPLHRLLEAPLAAEAALIAQRRRLPFGLSLLMVARAQPAAWRANASTASAARSMLGSTVGEDATRSA